MIPIFPRTSAFVGAFNSPSKKALNSGNGASNLVGGLVGVDTDLTVDASRRTDARQLTDSRQFLDARQFQQAYTYQPSIIIDSPNSTSSPVSKKEFSATNDNKLKNSTSPTNSADGSSTKGTNLVLLGVIGAVAIIGYGVVAK